VDEREQGKDQPTERPMPPIARAGRSATRFTREFMATLVAVVSTAIGVVVALAWNSALQAVFRVWLDSRTARAVALLVYAVVITAIGVVAILALGRLANRLDAQPIQFAYPAKKEEDH
jgi:sorbitol-specific phosphotransferase system component IIBC